MSCTQTARTRMLDTNFVRLMTLNSRFVLRPISQVEAFRTWSSTKVRLECRWNGHIFTKQETFKVRVQDIETDSYSHIIVITDILSSVSFNAMQESHIPKFALGYSNGFK